VTALVPTYWDEHWAVPEPRGERAHRRTDRHGVADDPGTAWQM